MEQEQMDRREFLKLEAAAMAAAAGGMPAPLAAQNLVTDRSVTELKWDKAPCRFCGTGCGVMVATKDGPRRRHPWRHEGRGQSRPQLRQRIFPLQGDVRPRPSHASAAAQAERPVRQERRIHQSVVGRSLRRDGREVQGRAQAARTQRRRHVRIGPMDDLGRLCRQQAVQGRLPVQQPRSERAPLHGVGRDGVHADVRHGRADGLLRRFRGRRRLRAVGLEHGGDAPDPVEPGHRPQAQRAARPSRGALDLRAPLVRARRHRDRVQAAERSRDPQRDRQPHHHDQSRQQGLRQQAHDLQTRPDRHRLRAAAGQSAGAEGVGPLEGGRRDRHHVRGLRQVRLGIHAGEGRRACPACR